MICSSGKREKSQCNTTRITIRNYYRDLSKTTNCLVIKSIWYASLIVRLIFVLGFSSHGKRDKIEPASPITMRNSFCSGTQKAAQPSTSALCSIFQSWVPVAWSRRTFASPLLCFSILEEVASQKGLKNKVGSCCVWALWKREWALHSSSLGLTSPTAASCICGRSDKAAQVLAVQELAVVWAGFQPASPPFVTWHPERCLYLQSGHTDFLFCNTNT